MQRFSITIYGIFMTIMGAYGCIYKGAQEFYATGDTLAAVICATFGGFSTIVGLFMVFIGTRKERRANTRFNPK